MDRADSSASLPAEGSRKHRVLRNAQTQQLEELMEPQPGWSAWDFMGIVLQGLVNVPIIGDLFHITFKYLLEIISPIVG